jgi:hypothetical protein
MASNLQTERRPHGNRWRLAVWGTAAFLLLLPLVAMQFTDEVDWDAADFIIIGILLLIACGTYEFGVKLSGSSTAYRAAFGLAIVTGFVLIWINLAVGIFGSEDNLENLMFMGVLVVGGIGAVISRFRPRGMAHALEATAAAQVAVASIGLVMGFGESVLLAALFALPWLGSALLFRKAAGDLLGMEAPR